jgi:hypothetical protein
MILDYVASTTLREHRNGGVIGELRNFAVAMEEGAVAHTGTGEYNQTHELRLLLYRAYLHLL